MALIGTLGSGVSSLRSFIKGLEVIGNNIANVNTTGYKTSTAKYADSFSNVLQYSSPSAGVASNTSSMQVGTGVRVSGITSKFTQGSLTSTGMSTDLGVSGNGFFRVRDPQNGREFVTRAGDFRLDDNGYLVTQQGFRVQGLSNGASSYAVTAVGGEMVWTATNTAPTAIGDVRIEANFKAVPPATLATNVTNSTGGAFTNAQVDAEAPTLQSYSIDQFGNVVAFLSNGDSFTRGQVLLQDFRDPTALMKEGNNLFTGFEAAGVIGGNALTAANNTPGTSGLGRIESGTLELANVDLTEEFANMITTQRSFQAGSRLVTVSDSVLEDIVNLKR